jgi:hypothetical protein
MAAMKAPSNHPMTHARADPAASMTVMMSSTCSSSAGTPGTGSDMPMPRLSKMITRRKLARRLAKAADSATSPRRETRRRGPQPGPRRHRRPGRRGQPHRSAQTASAGCQPRAWAQVPAAKPEPPANARSSQGPPPSTQPAPRIKLPIRQRPRQGRPPRPACEPPESHTATHRTGSSVSVRPRARHGFSDAPIRRYTGDRRSPEPSGPYNE